MRRRGSLRKHLLGALAAALPAVMAIPVQAGELRAGVGKVDITSAPDEFPYKWREELPFVRPAAAID